MEYLDFELPIKELEEQLDKCVIIGEILLLGSECNFLDIQIDLIL